MKLTACIALSLEYRSWHMLCLRLALCMTSVLHVTGIHCKICSSWNRLSETSTCQICAAILQKTVFSALLRHTSVFRLGLILWVRIWLWHTTWLIGERISVKRVCFAIVRWLLPCSQQLKDPPPPHISHLQCHSPFPAPLTNIGLPSVILDSRWFDLPLLHTSVKKTNKKNLANWVVVNVKFRCIVSILVAKVRNMKRIVRLWKKSCTDPDRECKLLFC